MIVIIIIMSTKTAAVTAATSPLTDEQAEMENSHGRAPCAARIKARSEGEDLALNKRRHKRQGFNL